MCTPAKAAENNRVKNRKRGKELHLLRGYVKLFYVTAYSKVQTSSRSIALSKELEATEFKGSYHRKSTHEPTVACMHRQDTLQRHLETTSSAKTAEVGQYLLP